MTTRDEERITEEIHQVRHDLGETVEALAHKADLPARAREKVAATPPRHWAVLAGVVAAVVAVLVVPKVLKVLKVRSR